MNKLAYLLPVVFLVALYRHQPLRAMVSLLPRPHKIFFAVLFLAILSGQIYRSKSDMYPFIKWGMYDDMSHRVKAYQYRGVRADGSEAAFPLSALLRVPKPEFGLLCPTCGKRYVWRMRGLGGLRRGLPPGPELDEVTALYDEMIRSAWRVYQARTPDADFVAVKVSLMTVVTADYIAGAPMDVEFLWRVDLL